MFRSVSSLIIDAGGTKYEELWVEIFTESSKSSQSIAKTYPSLKNKLNIFDFQGIDKSLIKKCISGCRIADEIKQELAKICHLDVPFSTMSYDLCTSISNLAPRAMFDSTYETIALYFFRNLFHFNYQLPSLIDELSRKKLDKLPIFSNVYKLISIMGQFDDSQFSKFYICLNETFEILRPKIKSLLQTQDQRIIKSLLDIFSNLTTLIGFELDTSLCLTFDMASSTLYDFLKNIKGELFVSDYIAPIKTLLELFLKRIDSIDDTQIVFDIAHLVIRNIMCFTKINKLDLLAASNICLDIILKSSQGKSITPKYLDNAIEYACWIISSFPDAFNPSPYTKENISSRKLPEKTPKVSNGRLSKIAEALSVMVLASNSDADCISILFSKNNLIQDEIKKKQAYYAFQLDVMKDLNDNIVVSFASLNFPFLNDDIFPSNHEESDDNLQIASLKIIEKCFHNTKYREPIFDILYRLSNKNPQERFNSFAPLLNTLLASVPSFSSDFVGHKIFGLFVDFAKESNEIFGFICAMTESSPDITLTSRAMVEFLLTNVHLKERKIVAVNCLCKGLSLTTINILHAPIIISIVSAISDNILSMQNNDEDYSFAIIDLITRSISKIEEGTLMQIIDMELFEVFAGYIIKFPSEVLILSIINCLIELSRRSPKILHKLSGPNIKIYSKLDRILECPIEFSLMDPLITLATGGPESDSIRNPRVLPLIMKWAIGRPEEGDIYYKILRWSIGSLNDIFAIAFGEIAAQVLESSINGPVDTREAMRDVYFTIARANFTERSFESLIRACRYVDSPSAHFALFKDNGPSLHPHSFIHFDGDDSGVWPFAVDLEGALSVNLTICLDMSADSRCDTLFELRSDTEKVLCMIRNSRIVVRDEAEEVCFGLVIVSRSWCFVNVSLAQNGVTIQVSGECETAVLPGMSLSGSYSFSFGRPTQISDCLYANCGEITITSGQQVWSISPLAVNDFEVAVGNGSSAQILGTAVPMAVTSRDLIISVDNIFKILALLERLEGCEECSESLDACPKCKALSSQEGSKFLARLLYTFALCSDDDRIDDLGDREFPKLLSAYLMRMKPCFFSKELFSDLVNLIPNRDCSYRVEIVRYIFLNFGFLTKFPEDVLKDYLTTTDERILMALRSLENYDFLVAEAVNYNSHRLSNLFWDFVYEILNDVPLLQPRWVFSLFISHQDQLVASRLYKFCEIIFMKNKIADDGLSILNNETFMPMAISLSKKDPDMHFRTFSFMRILLEEQRAHRLVSNKQLNILAWKSTVFMYTNIIEHMELLPKLIDTYKGLLFRNNGIIFSSIFFSLYVLVMVMSEKNSDLVKEIRDSIFLFRDGIRILYNNKMLFPLLFIMWDGSNEIQTLLLTIITNLVFGGISIDLKQFMVYAHYASFENSAMDIRKMERGIIGDLMQEACLNHSIEQPESIVWLYTVHTFFSITKKSEKHRDTFLEYISDYPPRLPLFNKDYELSAVFQMEVDGDKWEDEQLALNFIGILKIIGEISIEITSDLTVNSLLIAAYTAAMLIRTCSFDFDFGSFVDVIVPLLEKTDPLNAHRTASLVLHAIQSSNNNYPQAMSLEFFTLHYMDSDDSPQLQNFFFEDKLDKNSMNLADELGRDMRSKVTDYINTLVEFLEVSPSLREKKPFREVSAGYEEFSKKSAMIFEKGNNELKWMKESSETFLKNHKARLTITPSPFFSEEAPFTTKVISQVLNGKQSLTGIKLPPNDPPFINIPNSDVLFAASGKLCGPTAVYEGAILITSKVFYFSGKNLSSNHKSLEIPVTKVLFIIISKQEGEVYANVITQDRHYLFNIIERNYSSIIVALESIHVKVNEEVDPVIRTLRETGIYGIAGTDLINRAKLEELYNEGEIGAYDIILYANLLGGRSFDDMNFHVSFPLPLKSGATSISEETINMDMAESLTSQAVQAFYDMDASKFIDGHMDVPPHFFTVPQTHQNWRFATLCKQALESRLFEPMIIKWIEATFGIEFKLHRTIKQEDYEIQPKSFPASIKHIEGGVVAGSNTLQHFGFGDVIRAQIVIGDLFGACDNFFVTACAYESFLHISSLEKGEEICTLPLNSSAQLVAADHNMIACATSDSSIAIFERRFGLWREHQVTQFQVDAIESIAISSECGLVASISNGRSLVCEQALKKRFLSYVKLDQIDDQFRPEDGLPTLLIVCSCGLIIIVERSKQLNQSKFIALSSCGNVVAKRDINYFVEKIDIFERYGEENFIVASVCMCDGPALIKISLVTFDIIQHIKLNMKSVSNNPPKFSLVSNKKQVFYVEGQLLCSKMI